ncbi:MAG: hypothetical protein NZ529_06620 [Cytophagaceae bacterium]|nr:hypothetical protein [Cytophagaceae bacterium]MDW8456453.1 hypothetical protein [Cytophagaceae bacterium]
MFSKYLSNFRQTKLFRHRYLIFALYLIITLFVCSVYFLVNAPQRTTDIDINNIYNTWKIVKYYENGKLVVNDKRFETRRFRINRDGTADWINNGNETHISFIIYQDGRHLMAGTGDSKEHSEIIYELTENKLRFGKRNIRSHYEYVMVPYNYVAN